VLLSPLVITAVVLLTEALVFLIYRAIITATRAEVIGERESMLGLPGNVVRPLNPEGLRTC
jgi:membrane-bound ClpP family serine protease